jgi:hypothetical protein
MARFHLDHNVSNSIAQDLRHRRHDVVTARELGLTSADDDVHLWTAAGDKRIFVTHNREDFRLLHKAWCRWAAGWRRILQREQITVVFAAHPGVLIVPQAPHLAPETTAVEIDRLVSSGAPLANELYLYDWQTGRGWVREPPP